MTHVSLVAEDGHGEICSRIQGALNSSIIDYVE